MITLAGPTFARLSHCWEVGMRYAQLRFVLGLSIPCAKNKTTSQVGTKTKSKLNVMLSLVDNAVEAMDRRVAQIFTSYLTNIYGEVCT